MPAFLPRRKFIVFLVLAFLFRLAFGLCSTLIDPDAIQIYLLGLKFYTTGAWPYFGPDVVWGEIQIPGALQGLLVGLPFYLLRLPEAPYLLVNIISFASLCLLAWYCCKRLPNIPRWLVWIWLFTSPWTLNLSTHIYNPSYLLAAGILFFVGALELCPLTSKKLVDSRTASFMLGFAIFWAMQIHLSWIVLVPYVLIAFYFQARAGWKNLVTTLLWFAFGSAITGSLLLPTFYKYGFTRGMGGTNSAITFNPDNLLSLFGILKRSLSFAVFEVTNFIGARTPARVAFLTTQFWLIPVVLFLFLFGIAQGIALVVCWFKKDAEQTDWRAIKYLMVFNVVLLYVVFLFSIKPPQSNHLYLTLPVPMIYSLYVWNRFLSSDRWQRLAKALLACGIVFHIGLALYNLPRVSLYTVRSRIQSAIDNNDYRILGERRPNTLY